MRISRQPLKNGMLAALLAVISVLPAPVTSQEPVYASRLELPIAGDSIGYPRSVTADRHTDEIFVCDTRRGRILIYDGQGRLKFQIPGGDVFSAPIDLAIDQEGYLVVVANHQRRRTLVELDFDGLFLGEITLTGLPNLPQEPAIHSVAISPSGDRIYVVDINNFRLWITDRQGVVADSVDLAPGVSGKERQEVMLGHVDVYGDNVFVALRSTAAIRVLDLDGNDRARVGERGGAYCRLGRPVGAALTESGEVLIVDQQRMVITRWTLEGNRCLGEYYGLGNLPGYLYFPMDIALDELGQLFVSQGYQGRVQVYEGVDPAPAPARLP